MGLTRIERETVICFNEEESEAVLHTCSAIWMRKMDKLVEEHPESFTCTDIDKMDGEVIGKRYKFDKSLITIRQGKQKRELTEEQRAEVAERFRKAREAKA